MDHVAVSGLGVISPVGHDVETFWRGVIGGVCAISPIPSGEGLSGNRLWAAVPDAFLEHSPLPSSALRNADRFTHYALIAADEAVRQASAEPLDALRTAVVLGNTMGGFPFITAAQTAYLREGQKSVPPKLMALVIPNMPAARVSLHYRLHGPQLTVSNACASSLDAIGIAARMIERGEVDLAIAGGTEDLLCDLVYESLTRAGALSRNPDPSLASRPFDAERDGFVMGNGAAMLVLEHIEHARARGAHVLARIRGYGQVADAYHITSPEPSGEWEALAMRRALDDAALTPSQAPAAVFAHGTATVVGDAAELRAINRIYGRAANVPPVTSLKGHMGHSMAASGAMSLIAGIVGMEHGLVSQTLGTQHVDPAAQFEVVTGQPRSLIFSSFQVNAFGFGGQNSSLVVTR